MASRNGWEAGCACGEVVRAPSYAGLIAMAQAHALLEHKTLLPRAVVLDQLKASAGARAGFGDQSSASA